MKLKHAEAIVKASQDMGHMEELEVYEGYIGRGMRKPTDGVTGRLSKIIQAIAMVAGHAEEYEVDVDEFVDDMRLTMDSMGLDTIVY